MKQDRTAVRSTTLLRTMLSSDSPVVAPGVFDGLSARLVVRAGFHAVYVTGSAVSRSFGIPDLGLLSYSDIADHLERIVDVVDVPVIVDADNGYGNALNAQRAARAFERAGVAAFHIEDQAFPKRSGHFSGKQIVPIPEMQGKIRAVRDALHDSDFVVIARTDALSEEGFDAAVERCLAYREAGADMLYVDFPASEAQMQEIVRRLPGWNMALSVHGSKMPFLSVSRLEQIGFKLILLPTDLQRAVIRAMERTLETMSREGSSISMADDLASFGERDSIVGIEEFMNRSKRYGC